MNWRGTCGMFLGLALAANGIATMALAQPAEPKPADAAPANGDKIDVNTASRSELERLPGIGETEANHIVISRPYNSVEELGKAGLSQAKIAELKPLVMVGKLPPGDPAAPRKPSATAKIAPQVPTGKVDINNCTLEQLQNLPGVGAALAARLYAGRPYSNYDDIARREIPLNVIEGIKPYIVMSTDNGVRSFPPRQPINEKPPVEKAPANEPLPGGPLDLNSATVAALETLPGITPVYAKWIVAGRPYKTADDLFRAGLPRTAIDGIRSDVVVKPPDSAAAGAVPPLNPPKPGLVWVNEDAQIYYKKGSRKYGGAANGEWMTEADAIKSGNRMSRD